MLRVVVPVALAFLLIAACTVLQGYWSQRWNDTTSREMVVLVERYKTVPDKIGVWEGMDTSTNQRALDRAGAYGNISRQYRNTQTGEVVSVFLVCGYSRDIAVHTPDACYVSAGFEMEKSPVKKVIETDGAKAAVFTSTFRKERGESPVHQRILWSWNGGQGRWVAPTHPRAHFTGRAVINKIYLINDVSDNTQHTFVESPAVKFGKIFLPELNRALYPPKKEVAASEPS